ncbi:hypothetical protein C8A00DRAFT_14051 [Chaetomidium leptoderma]|uniref:JmjC domain-containing protein n=1 Tax=Chaetomidium leptoderma TaxID=669021 RepID=A0AAN6VNK7_9PEZI|nr:hypothetical protein C8A00DRAFT_14051 [Chaetomidium leptoderma]
MDALHPKVDSISGEVSQISVALRGYLEHGFASGRKVQPPKTKAGRDLLQHLLGRLDQVSTSLNDVRSLAVPHLPSSPTPAVRGPDTPLSSDTPAISQQTLPSSGQADQKHQVNSNKSSDHSAVPDTDPVAPPKSALSPPLPITSITAPVAAPVSAPITQLKPALSPPITAIPSATNQDCPLPYPGSYGFRLKDGSAYHNPLPSDHASPLFDCIYQDIRILNEELFELYSSHPVVREVGYFKIQVRDLPPLNVQKVARPSKDHATSFSYKSDRLGLVKVDTGKRFKFASPHLPLPMSAKVDWSLPEQRDLWNSSAADPPKGTRPYIIGNPLFYDVELSPGEKLRRRGRALLEGINTQYVYFNLTGKTITTMHREDAHVRSENLLRSGQHKFWCFIKPAFGKKLEERMAVEYPEMRRCSQAVRHLSRHIPPAKLDEWGVEYTLDYCVPGQAVVTEPGTYHQVLNLGPNYAIAINLEYNSSPDMPPDYQFCDRLCPDKFAMTAEDFRIQDKPPALAEEQLPRTPETTGSQEGRATVPALEDISGFRAEPTVSQLTQSATPPPERAASGRKEPGTTQPPSQSGVRLPEQVFPQRHELAPPPVSRGNAIPPQPPEPLRAEPSTQTPQQSVSSAHGPVERPNPPPQEANGAQVFAPSESPPAPGAAPGATAYSVQIVPQAAPFIQRDAHHCGHFDSRMTELPPLRKTARMINPYREDDTPNPRPPKKQRVESPPALAAQNWPVRGPLEQLSTLLRGHGAARTGSSAAEKLSGKPAFERLAHLVREWRRYSKSTPMVLGEFGLVKAVEETQHGYPELHLFLLRFFKMKVTTSVETTIPRLGQPSQQSCMNAMLQTLGWDESKRSELHDYLREGKCWATICGDFDGLLCLIPSDSDCLNLALFKDEVARFHADLDTDFVRKLCAVGSILQRSIWECLELPEFIWESMTTTWLPVNQIPPLLAPFRILKSNYYDQHNVFYWPRPAGWHWDWPTDPSVVRPGDKACGLCARKSCRCAETKVPQIPRISDDRSKGPGVRSVGSHKANDILGELVGELVPLGSCASDWTMALHRPDMDDEAVADIYPRRMGNWVRKVNHSTNPSAMFRVMKISGRWRQMLVAMRNIGDGDEITAKYGKGFLKDQPYSLVEGLH